MKTYAPDYYKDFKCIADKCRHNCCMGWEIDIDEETAKHYKTIDGEIGNRLKANIAWEKETPHFILGENERCPFLNENNLCDVISELGEDKLCGICKDHPRFRNFFGDRIEIGVGLCCEVAAELIITNTAKPKIIVISENNEKEDFYAEDEVFFALREKIFNIMQNRNESFSERLERLVFEFELNFADKNTTRYHNHELQSDTPEPCRFHNKTPSEWAEVFLKLEHLDNEWVDGLCKMKDTDFKACERQDMDTELEQLFVYFVYRHFADGIFDGRFKERLGFAILGIYMIYHMSIVRNTIDFNVENLADTARMYSAEIEYMEENIDTLIDIFSE